MNAEKLTASRLQSHWALQLPAGVSKHLAEPRPDFSHLSFTWDSQLWALVGKPTRKGTVAGLRVQDLTVLLGEKEFPLDGKTMEQALDWLVEELQEENPPGEIRTIRQDIPEHAVGKGETFSAADRDSFGRLAEGFATASLALGDLQRKTENAGALQCWPHHFDTSTLILLDPEKDPEEARSINAGFSPGDSTFEEPYFYVNPWPYPKPADLPALKVGTWHTEGWTGAVLRGSDLGDRDVLVSFLEGAVAAGRKALGF